MAENKKLPTFNEQKIDLEVDFGDRGGIQRFSHVSDLKQWIKEENEFWNWLGQSPQNQQFSGDGFRKLQSESQNNLNRFASDWDNLQKQRASLEDQKKQDGENPNVKAQLEETERQGQNILKSFTDQMRSTFKTHILDRKSHICRNEPEAQFVAELAQVNPVVAVHALDYFLRSFQGNDPGGIEKAKGYLLAGLHEQGLQPTQKTAGKAFEEAIQTWSRELSEYRSRYDELKAAYEGLKKNNHQTSKRWEAKTKDMGEQFDQQLQKNDQDLANLKETYEAHMVLKGPMRYWGRKRKDHDTLIKKLRRMLIGWSIAGALLLFVAAYLLLPEFHPSDNIPWRQIGFFVLTSTFVLWFIRLLVKLLLSNIHLSADAREREVMIQTFMALMRHKESRDGVTKQDIALVLAPIFKPSTTGVIKDEGGPITLTDFISRMGGK